MELQEILKMSKNDHELLIKNINKYIIDNFSNLIKVKEVSFHYGRNGFESYIIEFEIDCKIMRIEILADDFDRWRLEIEKD